MCINNTSHLIDPIKRSNNSTLFVWNTKFTLGRPKTKFSPGWRRGENI